MSGSGWHWEGFDITYKSLDEELQCSGYYIRLFLQALNQDKIYKTNSRELRPLIKSIYNHAVIEDRTDWKLNCLQLITSLFKKYPKVLIVLEPLPYFVWLLDPKHSHPLWRDHILNFFASALTNVYNANAFVKTGGLEHLNRFINYVHKADHEIENVDGEMNSDRTMSRSEVAQSSIALVRLLCQKLPRL